VASPSLFLFAVLAPQDPASPYPVPEITPAIRCLFSSPSFGTEGSLSERFPYAVFPTQLPSNPSDRFTPLLDHCPSPLMSLCSSTSPAALDSSSPPPAPLSVYSSVSEVFFPLHKGVCTASLLYKRPQSVAASDPNLPRAGLADWDLQVKLPTDSSFRQRLLRPFHFAFPSSKGLILCSHPTPPLGTNGIAACSSGFYICVRKPCIPSLLGSTLLSVRSGCSHSQPNGSQMAKF